MFEPLSGFGTHSPLICVGLVFHNLQCALGQDYYSVPAYSLCSFLPDRFVNRYLPPIPLFFMLLTELVSALALKHRHL